VAKLAVVDASPLIFLSSLNLLDILHHAGDPILVPLPVILEVQQAGPTDPAVVAVAQSPWLQAVDPGPASTILQFWKLGAGESAVLTYALANPTTEVLLDDRKARRCASALGIAVRGTISLVLQAKRDAIIPSARPVLEQLRRMGMHLSDRVMNQSLALVGE
jgi:predicted nucleic acid-binding protein